MGVVNVTPDSFSDGGAWYGADTAIAHGLELVAQGADIVDVGGESTRPGAQRIDVAEELRRVGPVVTELVRAGVPVSIDTMRAQVAEFALGAGVHLVNDVSGGLADPDMPRLVAAAGVPYVVMHWRGHSHDMYSRAVYHDVVAEVRDELARRVDEVVKAGVDPGCVVIDPGLGFGKRPEHNWPLLAHLADLSVLGGRRFPVLIGASRKRFIGRLLAGPDGEPRSFSGSDDATVATTALAAAAGAWCVRVHRVPANADAVRVAAAWRGADRGDAVLAIGSNLGDRLGTLRQAVAEIGQLPDTEVLAVSPVYETVPVGGPAQPDYLNAVLMVRTGLRPRDLLDRLNRIEAARGRVREVRFGPRTLDIDIISYADQTSDDPVLTLPHPRAHERAFVLAPWHDIDAGAVLPGGSVADLLAGLDRGGIRRRPESLLPSEVPSPSEAPFSSEAPRQPEAPSPEAPPP
jgi:dihydropteroate synthase